MAAGPPSRDLGPLWVALLDVAVLVLSLPLVLGLASVDRSVSIPVAAAVLLLFLLSEWFPVDLELREQAHTVSFTAVPLIVGLALLPPELVIVLRLAASGFVLGVVQRQQALKFLTNVVSHVFQVAVAAALIVPFVDGVPTTPLSWLVVAGAIVAAELAGMVVVTAAIALFERGFDREMVSGTLTGWAMVMPDAALGLVCAILLDVSPAAVVLAALVGISLAAAVRAYAQVTARYRVLEVLDRFTKDLGTAVVDGDLHASLLAQLRELLHAEVAWIEVGDDPDLRFRLDGWGGRPELTQMPATAHGLRHRIVTGSVHLTSGIPGPPPAHGGAAPADEATVDEIVGAVSVGSASLLVGVEGRRGDVRSFDDEDVRLFDLLVAHIGVALQNVRLVDQLRTEVRANQVLATRDQLTGLPNRTLFLRSIDEALAQGDLAGVLLVGLDRFKEVNDTLGHQTGDELLREVGRRVQSCLDPSIKVARLGGDEFAVLWPKGGDRDVADRSGTVLDAIDGLHDLAGMQVDVSASGGIALAEPGSDAITLLRQADVAMYLAKQARVPLEVYRPEKDTSSPARLAMAGHLRAAIEAGDLTLHYQPQLALPSKQLIGAEALVRWHPAGEKYPVSPVDFIEVAERTGLIHPLTRVVLRESVRQSAAWAATGRPVRISANLSARNLEDETLVPFLASLLAEYGLPPHLFEVEVTETSVMNDPEVAIATLLEIHRLGVSISVDDFGTGHSSLAYLTRLPVSQLKIDRSFVMEIAKAGSGRAVVHAIIDLAGHLELEVVAEGVETEVHVELLREMGCDIGQGYFFARPMPPADFADWAAAHELAHPPSRRATDATADRGDGVGPEGHDTVHGGAVVPLFGS